MFSPNTSEPLAKILCHKAAVNDLSVHRNGHYLTTTGSDGLWKIWDLRNYKMLFDYWTP
jgi:U3 small nucleolar RNA-associated protein 7